MSNKSIQKMIIKTISDKRYMTYQHYKNRPMQMVERHLFMIFAKNPHFIILLNTRLCNPLMGEYSHRPLNKCH